MKRIKNAPVVVMNFSGAYNFESFDKDSEIINLDFRQLHGTEGYCSHEAAKVIKDKIQPFGPHGMHFLDNGDYHYVSKFWTDMITEPFSLVLIDHHTDMQDSRVDGILSCGDWVKAVIQQNKFLEKVIVIGVPRESALKVDKELFPKVVFVTEPEFKDYVSGRKEPVDGKTIYISIDKDALSPEDAVTNWDQGDMKESDLRKFLFRQVEHENVIGVDVCGEFQVVSNYFADELPAEKDNNANLDILLTVDTAEKEKA